MPDTDRNRSPGRRKPSEANSNHRPDTGSETADDDAPNAQPGHEAHPTTTRDTVEDEAYAQAHSAPEAEHATNQTTDDSLRKQRSRTL